MNNRSFKEDLTALLTVVEEVPKRLVFTSYVTKEMENTPVEDFVETTRSRNVLHRGHINTAKDLYEKWDTLLKIRGGGEKCVKEIKNGYLEWYYSQLEGNEIKKYWEEFIEANDLVVM